MPFDFNATRERIAAVFSDFTAGQKVMTGLAAVALVVGGLFFMQWSGRPSYAPLYSNLDPSDASAITQKLSSEGVPYQLANNGTTVMVPDDRVHQVRLDVSAAGLPAGGASGYALLDKQGITTSEFRQRVDYQRALEGEISKTVGSIDGVDAATVHLVIPRDDLFAEDETRPTASVLVRTRPGARMPARQVQAIVHLVSSSVEGMNPKDVTVADAAGNVLASPGLDGVDAAANDLRAEQRTDYENKVAESVKQLLGKVVGVDGSVVTVNADLDFDQRETESETVEPAEPPASTSERVVTETFTGNNSTVGGALGPNAPVGNNTGESDYQRQEEERQMAVNRTLEKVKAAPGTVRRLSVAVLIDSAKGADIQPAEIEDVVGAAVGFDAERGDTVQVSQMAFDRSLQEDAEEDLKKAQADAQRRDMLNLIRTVGSLAIVFIVLFLAYRSARRSRSDREPIPLESLALPAGDRMLTRDEVAELEAAVAQAERALDDADLPQLQMPAVESEVVRIIDRQPEEVAALLRGWLADRRTP